ncbi:Cysteine proteinase inhibitor 5 [Linum perenne]
MASSSPLSSSGRDAEHRRTARTERELEDVRSLQLDFGDYQIRLFRLRFHPSSSGSFNSTTTESTGVQKLGQVSVGGAGVGFPNEESVNVGLVFAHATSSSKEVLQIVVLTLLIAAGIASAKLGGWTEIAHTDDPDVSEAVNFTVKQHNVEADTKLKLKKVDHAKYQVVNGKNYRLTLTVTNDGKKDTVSQYVTVVYVPPARSGV